MIYAANNACLSPLLDLWLAVCGNKKLQTSDWKPSLLKHKLPVKDVYSTVVPREKGEMVGLTWMKSLSVLRESEYGWQGLAA